ncbi:reprolysin-like metallopeptidase [Poritiphilus flavus]|uniref:T9SS type A sorting domain-containing protein n=1 Tax=Poritiphilus flavus TaxID=2697053 RepID=A0A6L9E7E1_9FLAO|nr:zinc-dependent metalloprotease family protein [Poritiphilus flavus]NAS10646.1 T9SS type A sorting domain-containing protein [Poritiphilus flavus]
MFAKLHLVLPITILFLLLSFSGAAQTSYWKQEIRGNEITSPALQRLDIKKTRFFSLEQEAISQKLALSGTSASDQNILHFPDQKGKLVAYRVVETPVLAPELARKYPSIKSYTGYALQGHSRIRFSISHKGFQGMIVYTGTEKTLFIDKSSDNGDVYVVYPKDSHTGYANKLVCNTPSAAIMGLGPTVAKLVDDQILRRFRIAVSATGEYTQFHGGTVADALAAINGTLTRVNEVFERDLGVTLELVATTDQVIYTDPETDPYSGNLNAQVQTTLTSEIGEANYDVGHLFHRANNNGNAGFIGSVCRDNQKGSAFAATTAPQGDIFDLDFVAHELGHQFGANHTWSFESEGTQVQAEPGSGTTIMGYAGIAGANNVAPNGDDYFHYFSIQQITDYLETVSCAQETALTNSPPVITPTGNFIIPKSTAFVLTANATDPDAGDVLTYAWEQIDDGVVTNETFGPNRPNGANFRSLRPSSNPARYFPRLSEVAQGNLTQTDPELNSAWETVSDVQREMNFALTVRDNAEPGGQVSSDFVNISVQNGSGPFRVTSQSGAEVYTAGSIQQLNWDVANTDQLPVNAQFVDIFLSTDGGLSFPIQLAQNVVNDGEHEVLIPGDATTSARIMVKASDNVFFAVNTTNFTIQQTDVVLSFSELDYEVCQPDNLVIPFTLQTFGAFSEEVTFSLIGAPAGLSSAFSPAMASANNTDVDLTLSGTAGVTPGTYPVTVRGEWTGGSAEVDLNLSIYDAAFSDVVLSTPANSSTTVSLNPLFEWEANASATSYDIEIATDVAFGTIVAAANVAVPRYKALGLNQETQYFWRVRPKNSCGDGNFSSPFDFQTVAVNCKTITASGLPINIPAVGTPTITSTVSFINNLPINDLRVTLDLEHSFLADLTISLTSPQGTTVTLVANSCGDLSDINAVFTDSGPSFNCQGNPGISGTVKPLGALSSFAGESLLGDWTLTIADSAPADGGVLNNFSLEICVEGELRPDDDGDGVFDDGDDLCLGTPPGAEVGVDGCEIFRFPPDNFTVAIQGETCIANDNGSIEITAMQSMDYTLTVNGNGVDVTENFTTNYQLENLEAGTYSICITGTDGTNTFEPFCFEAVVSEPESLDVSSQLILDSQQITLTLSGSENYVVELNGVETQTNSAEITLSLKQGLNTLKVSTDLSCQGTYEEVIFNSDRPILYPNPVSSRVSAFLGATTGTVNVEVFDANGRFIKARSYNLVGESEISIDMSELAAGLYFVNLRMEGGRETYKLVKR